MRQRERKRETYSKGTSRKRGRITKRLKNFQVNGRTERLDRRSNSEGQRKEREIERKRERDIEKARKKEIERDIKRESERQRVTEKIKECNFT